MARPTFLLPALPLLLSVPLVAQPVVRNPDSLRAVIMQADSAGHAVPAVEGRLMLAPLTGPAEARLLLHQAAALADSLDRPDLGATALRQLGERMARTGNYRAAYMELLRADSLERSNALREWTRLEHAAMARQGLLALEQDSVAKAGREEQRRMAQAIQNIQQRTDAWMYSALVAMALGVLLVVGLLYRVGKLQQKRRTDLEELRRELARLKRADTVRAMPADSGAAVGTEGEAGLPERSAEAVDDAMKPVASGMFVKDAPERLTTLREARLRGDNEKVLRVLATLKPQLLSVDAARYTPLIARLREPGAPANGARWNADLDLLEEAVHELWKHHGAQ